MSIAFLIVVLLLVYGSGIALGSEQALSRLGLMGFFLGGAWLACRSNPLSRAGNAAAGFGLVLFTGALGAATSMLVLRWGFPQADPMLLSADAAIGFDARDVIAATAARKGICERLWLCYSNSIVYLIYAVPVVGLLGNRQLMWKCVFVYAGTLLTICLISGLVPAKGTYLLLDPAVIARMPPGAGTYFFSTFEAYRFGDPQVLSFATLNGVAAFPSFHTATALIMTMLLWPVRLLRPTAAIWCGIVVFSTIPMGGHYFVDLVAGTLVFFLWARLADLIVAGVRLPRLAIRPALRPAA